MFEISGFWLRQRGEEQRDVFISSIPVKHLSRHSRVEVVERGTTGVQRLLMPARVNKVKNFFNVSTDNIIPTALCISINKQPVESEDASGCQKLSFECVDDEKFITIVDGQHRLEGMSKCQQDLRVLVAAFVKPSDEELAFQFLVINNKSHKVPNVHVKSIIANYETIESDLGSRLNMVGISHSQIPDVDLIDIEDESPLKGLVKWTNNPNGVIPVAAIENSLKYIVERVCGIEEDNSLKRDILYQIWKAIKDLYSTRLDFSGESLNHLLEKAPFIVVTSMMVDYSFNYCDTMASLDQDISVYDEDTFYNSTKIFFKSFPEKFWSLEWTKKGLDTSAGRILIKHSIQKIKDNIRNNEEDVIDGITLFVGE